MTGNFSGGMFSGSTTGGFCFSRNGSSGMQVNPCGQPCNVGADGGRIRTGGSTRSLFEAIGREDFESPATTSAIAVPDVRETNAATIVAKRALLMGTPIILRHVPHGRVLIYRRL